MRVAAVDVGTNSTRLLVARVDREHKVQVLQSDLKTTRLGEGISSGYLDPLAMERTLTAVRQFVEQARESGAENIVLAATSAVRDAVNGRQFADMIRQQTGCPLLILPGEMEAELSYRGVLAGMPGESDGVTVVDIGGGSTEFSWQEAGSVHYHSVNVGAVRMTEGGHSDEQIAELLQPVLARVKGSAGKLVAVGGTATTIAAMIQKLTTYDWQKVHGFPVSLRQVEDLLQKLNAAALEERRSMPGLQPERADIIPAGVRIIRAVLKGLGVSGFVASEADILWGLVINAAIDVERKSGTAY
ncbi:exopolyphosphatase/guanosine-5'-triphosphate,3'-diphosphate pyrophosphatase [Desulfohalotomaculum tongense]|uniref:Ppx/GppA phosphatase family protein n=1 Tax=Desulforadius tongensis TaxID=1216062 RepID=UPI0019568B48|nr:Ppx/GppA family phosphatase [Desulforadius tongensis]MBM7855983.1 exopolyphosphatase/guanosine-5'-triphosphate,3'-diphosphate pyrophosphatase [Desulforadius tongensis]